MEEQSPPEENEIVPLELSGIVSRTSSTVISAPALMACPCLTSETASWNWNVRCPRPCGQVASEYPPQKVLPNEEVSSSVGRLAIGFASVAAVGTNPKSMCCPEK